MKLFLALLLVAVIAASGCTGQPAFQEPESRKTGGFIGEDTSPEPVDTEYPLLYKNIRFAEMPIGVWLDLQSAYRLENFSEKGIQDVRNALANWSQETSGLIRFEEVPKDQAQITVQWVGDSALDSAGQLGEGGPTVIDTGRYNLTIAGTAKVELTGYSCLNFIV